MSEVKRCPKCFHRLPPGRRTWKPVWQKWPDVDLTSLHYAADGPALGKICRDPSDDQWIGHIWDGNVIYKKLPGRFDTPEDAKGAVEDMVRQRGLWDPYGREE